LLSNTQVSALEPTCPAVHSTIPFTLNELPEAAYPEAMWEEGGCDVGVHIQPEPASAGEPVSARELIARVNRRLTAGRVGFFAFTQSRERPD
jgi:hypothetical protein